ncbi:MAG: hypothetical protein A2992_00355 [Elusimicrobia bacterium RIFCSPLOWO2_01_FULL_59_12]|nr:MAG: hypothetical protein A2992_00355 [Elusimicrobia bacterium RIFCSPLOWO2_01_FULL_59_12]
MDLVPGRPHLKGVFDGRPGHVFHGGASQQAFRGRVGEHHPALRIQKQRPFLHLRQDGGHLFFFLPDRFEQPGVFYRHRRLTGERLERFHVGLAERRSIGTVDDFHHADQFVPDHHRDRQDRFGFKFALFVGPLRPARVPGDIIDHRGLFVFRHPAGDALALLEPDLPQGPAFFPQGHVKIKLACGGVLKQKRRGFRPGDLAGQAHHRGQEFG